MGIFKDANFGTPKQNKSEKQAFCCRKNWHGIVSNSGCFDYSELVNIFPRTVKNNHFPGRKENCKFTGSLLDGEVTNLDRDGSPKFQDLLDEEMWICSSYTFIHKTLGHCAERQAKVFGNWIMHHIKI